MSEDFNDLNDILKKWTEDGPKEDQGPRSIAHVDVTVWLVNGSHATFHNAEVMDIGARLVIIHEQGSTIFNERQVAYYDIEDSEED